MAEVVFTVEEVKLEHEGIIPGARGHKKVIVSPGTRIYCIREPGGKYFWCGYLYFAEALEVAKSFVETIKPEAKRPISFRTLVAWNFKHKVPSRIHRPKEVKKAYNY